MLVLAEGLREVLCTSYSYLHLQLRGGARGHGGGAGWAKLEAISEAVPRARVCGFGRLDGPRLSALGAYRTSECMPPPLNCELLANEQQLEIAKVLDTYPLVKSS